jgi:hypothetical protein
MPKKKKSPAKGGPGEKEAKAFVNKASMRADPYGSYTGSTRRGDRPVQDADDL